MPQLLTIDHHSQPPIHHTNIRLIPFVRSVSLRLPGLRGGFVWKKPTTMLVSYPDGREEVFSIPDQTGRFFLYMLLCGLFSWLAFRWLRHTILTHRSY